MSRIKWQHFAFPAAAILFLLLGLFFAKDKTWTVASPLPDYLNRAVTFGVTTLSLWLPRVEIVQSLTAPEISSRAALIYNVSTEKILYSKNLKTKLPIASLVKIMTAIVALENAKLADEFIVSETASKIGENSMGLTVGEKYTLRDLLYGLMLVSGNDAAEVIAENILGRENFIRAMNDKAKSLGLVDTYFVNPSGLEEDIKEYSTVYDLLVITKYALSIPEFAKVVSTYEYIIPYSSHHKALFLYNDTNLLTTYPGVKGVKPGYTPRAGLCLVTYAEKNGHKIIGIILNSEKRRDEMKELLNLLL